MRCLTPLVAALSLLLSACAGPPSPYAPGRSAADIPSRIDIIRLDSANTLKMWHGGGEFADRVDAAPSRNNLEVTNVAKAAAMGQFENFGIHVVEDGSRAPDLRLALYVGYIPEAGLFVHRAVVVGVYVLDPDDNLILKETAAALNQNGVINAILESRDAMVTRVARDAVQTTFRELGKGTKTPAAHPTS